MVKVFKTFFCMLSTVKGGAAETPLPFNFKPDAAFPHPIYGKKMDYPCLLVEVYIRKKFMSPALTFFYSRLRQENVEN